MSMGMSVEEERRAAGAINPQSTNRGIQKFSDRENVEKEMSDHKSELQVITKSKRSVQA